MTPRNDYFFNQPENDNDDNKGEHTKQARKKLKRYEERLDKLEKKLDKGVGTLVFTSVYWDNCPLERLKEQILKHVDCGNILREEAEKYLKEIRAGRRPKFPNWRADG